MRHVVIFQRYVYALQRRLYALQRRVYALAYCAITYLIWNTYYKCLSPFRALSPFRSAFPFRSVPPFRHSAFYPNPNKSASYFSRFDGIFQALLGFLDASDLIV